jgi:hypothetical protein
MRNFWVYEAALDKACNLRLLSKFISRGLGVATATFSNAHQLTFLFCKQKIVPYWQLTT